MQRTVLLAPLPPLVVVPSTVVISKYTIQNIFPKFVILIRCSVSPDMVSEVYTRTLNVSFSTKAVVVQNVGASSSIVKETFVRYDPVGRCVANTFT